MSCGVPAGMTTPFHEPPSKPFTPPSSTLGNSGIAGKRSRVEIAIAFNLPFFTWGMTPMAVLNAS